MEGYKQILSLYFFFKQFKIFDFFNNVYIFVYTSSYLRFI